jgi:hypothetical protein
LLHDGFFLDGPSDNGSATSSPFLSLKKMLKVLAGQQELKKVAL